MAAKGAKAKDRNSSPFEPEDGRGGEGPFGNPIGFVPPARKAFKDPFFPPFLQELP